VDPFTPTILYAGINDIYYNNSGQEFGVFKSVNGGAAWVHTSLYIETQALTIDPHSPTTLYAGTANGVFKSTNSGVDWIAMNNGLTTTNIQALAIDPLIPTILYAGTPGGVFKSPNGGATWIAVNNGLTSLNVLALAIDPSNPKRLYAGTFGRGAFELEQGNHPITSVNIAGPTIGVTNTPYTLEATISPLTATLPITYVWQTAGQEPVTHTNGLSDTVSFTWNTPGTKVVSIAATNLGSTVIDTQVLAITPIVDLAITKTAPTTATPTDLIPYTLTITNSGKTTATNLVITDAIPTGANYVTGGTKDGAVIKWIVSTLPMSARTQVSFVVMATTTITNSDYRVSASGGYSATGSKPIVTIINTNAPSMQKIYLPVIFKQ
jgi:uncharacterized repeat protein (TIGR01451 family)